MDDLFGPVCSDNTASYIFGFLRGHVLSVRRVQSDEYARNQKWNHLRKCPGNVDECSNAIYVKSEKLSWRGNVLSLGFRLV
jgi:hypothetical protein